MAYAAAASLSQTIDLVLNFYQNCFNLKFKNQIISLQKHTIFLGSFLEESPHSANNWEEIIREATEMAEDLIELILSDLLLGLTVGSSRSSFGEGRDYQLPYGFVELERAIQQIESITNRVNGRHAEAMGGPDDEVMEIVSLLLQDSSQSESIAIFGREGMGKTTLAKNVYNHPLVVEHFDIRAWCALSSEYGWSQIASGLPSVLFENKSEMRFLIVVDDVRTLEDLKMIDYVLPNVGYGRNGYNGSRVLATTRFFRLSKSVDHFHHMHFMDEDKTWNMLREKIFGRLDHYPFELETLGKKIAISCRGHPLTMDVVSGILAIDQTVAAWEVISDNIDIASENVDRRLFKVLSLGYTYLPHHLRPCFLYLGIFPKDEEIHVPTLIKLWVAEGFLDESESKSFEETGEEHLNALLRRNLVSVGQRKYNGRIKSIRIHDVMRELCLRRAHIDNFLLQFRGLDWQAEVIKLQWCRRVSIFSCADELLEGVYCPMIRTIILSIGESRLGLTRLSIGNVRLLRILDLSNAYSYDLPEEVFELFHLRYLAFYCGFSISEAISNLQNLQTLIICPRENGEMFKNLPKGIWRMPQLRHLLISSFKLTSQRGGTSALENLQTFSGAEDFICSIENLKMIPNLKKLALLYSKNLRNVVEDYELHNLIYLQKLEILKIETNWYFAKHHKMSCAFPPTLKKLNLSGLGLPWEDMESVALLPNLQVLQLRKHACIGGTWKTSEGGFCQLTCLLIDESNLKNWITKTSHFPKLKCLALHRCLCLLTVPNDIGARLDLIELDEQNLTLLSSAEHIQKNKPSCGFYVYLQIRVV